MISIFLLSSGFVKVVYTLSFLLCCVSGFLDYVGFLCCVAFRKSTKSCVRFGGLVAFPILKVTKKKFFERLLIDIFEVRAEIFVTKMERAKAVFIHDGQQHWSFTILHICF